MLLLTPRDWQGQDAPMLPLPSCTGVRRTVLLVRQRARLLWLHPQIPSIPRLLALLKGQPGAADRRV